MDRIQTIQELKSELADRKFSNIECGGCFDLISRKRETYLIKVLSNIDSFTEKEAKNIKASARFLEAKPVIISEKSRKGKIYDGVIHKRYGIPAVTPSSFIDFTDGIKPSVISSRSGLNVKIDSESVLNAMKKQRLNEKDISRALGITSITAKKIIDGGSVSLNLAIRLEEFFDTPVSKDIGMDIDCVYEEIEPVSGIERKTIAHMSRTGIEFSLIHRSSFNLAAKGRKTAIARVSDNITQITSGIEKMKIIAKEFRIRPFIISDKTYKDEVEDVPVFDSDYFEEMISNGNIMEFIH